jgi:hypothetical protein
LTGKYFPLTNFSNGKQTHENLKTRQTQHKSLLMEKWLHFQDLIKLKSGFFFFVSGKGLISKYKNIK